MHWFNVIKEKEQFDYERVLKFEEFEFKAQGTERDEIEEIRNMIFSPYVDIDNLKEKRDGFLRETNVLIETLSMTNNEMEKQKNRKKITDNFSKINLIETGVEYKLANKEVENLMNENEQIKMLSRKVEHPEVSHYTNLWLRNNDKKQENLHQKESIIRRKIDELSYMAEKSNENEREGLAGNIQGMDNTILNIKEHINEQDKKLAYSFSEQVYHLVERSSIPHEVEKSAKEIAKEQKLHIEFATEYMKTKRNYQDTIENSAVNNKRKSLEDLFR